MWWFHAPARRPVSIALATLVFAALSHCSWHESLELAQNAAVARNQRAGGPIPLRAPLHDGKCESGCICQGATLVHALDATHLNGDTSLGLSLLTAPPARPIVADASASLVQPKEWVSSAPPLSGRQLRALYASLVI